MKLKDRIKTAGCWSGLIGTGILMLSAFGVEIGDQTAGAVINTVCSALAVFGVISSPKPDGCNIGGGDGFSDTQSGENDNIT